MPALSEIPREPIRLLLIGNSGAGKTGALLSLVKAGYTLHILDTDRKAADLFRALCPDQFILSRIDIENVGEKFEIPRLGQKHAKIKGAPKAFERSMAVLEKWLHSGFDRHHIVVIDSFTALSKFAGNVAANLNGRDVPIFQDFPAAFALLRPTLELLTSFDASDPETFHCHVIVVSHILHYEVKQKTGEKIQIGKTRVDETTTIDTIALPRSIGQSLSPEIPTYFNSMLYVAQRSTNDSRRVIFTVPEGLIPVKTPVQGLARTLPVETGLATFFAAQDPASPANPQPTSGAKRLENSNA